MGDPELAVRGALVAGTNGKGSVIALAGSALRAAGYRVGETPKPHLVTYRERIVVDGRPIAAADFARLVDEALPAADRIARRLGPPTEFELLTAVMFRHFAEVGPGRRAGRGGSRRAPGRHQRLGRRRGRAHERGPGPHRPPRADDRARSPARRRRSSSAATWRSPAPTARRWRSCGGGARGWACPWPWRRRPRSSAGRGTRSRVDLPRLGAVDVGLRGRHQAANAAVADGLLDALEPARDRHGARRGAAPRATRRRAGRGAWSCSRCGCRASGEPREVLLDGAHNPDGAAALALALDDLRPHLAGGGETPPAPLTLVWASMADKDVEGVVTAAARARGPSPAPRSSAPPWTCRARCPPRTWPRPGGPRSRGATSARPRPRTPRWTSRSRRGAGPVVVAGSLYLVGAARARLVDDPALRDPDEA